MNRERSDRFELRGFQQHTEHLHQVVTAAQDHAAGATTEYWPWRRDSFGCFSMRYSGHSLVRRNTLNTARSRVKSIA